MHDHKMRVHRGLGHSGQLVYHRKAEGNVGNQRPVHHIEMNHVAALVDKPDILLEMEEVGGENRWSNPEIHGCGGL